MNEKSVKCCSDLEEDDVKVTKKGKKNRIIDDSDSDDSSEESKRNSSKSNENVASSNDDGEDSHSEPQRGKRKQPKISELSPKKIKLCDSSNKSKKPTKKEAISGKIQSDGSDSETSSIEDNKRSNISKKSKPVAKALLSTSKKPVKKQKLSSSEDEALENEDNNIVNKKIFEGSDSDESEPLQTYKGKNISFEGDFLIYYTILCLVFSVHESHAKFIIA